MTTELIALLLASAVPLLSERLTVSKGNVSLEVVECQHQTTVNVGIRQYTGSWMIICCFTL